MPNTENPESATVNDAHIVGKRLFGAVKTSIGIRLSIASIIAVAVAAVILPTDVRLALELKAIFYLGPAIILGGLVGWLTFNKWIWLWTTIGLAAATLALETAFPGSLEVPAKSPIYADSLLAPGADSPPKR